MAVLKITLTPVQYHQLFSTNLNLQNFLSDLLKSDSAAAKVIEHLTCYHSQNGDICQIDDFDIHEGLLQANHIAGTVVISYLIQYHYGCADITRQAKDHETWRFEIDREKQILSLHMPEYEVRSTADEF